MKSKLDQRAYLLLELILTIIIISFLFLNINMTYKSVIRNKRQNKVMSLIDDIYFIRNMSILNKDTNKIIFYSSENAYLVKNKNSQKTLKRIDLGTDISLDPTITNENILYLSSGIPLKGGRLRLCSQDIDYFIIYRPVVGTIRLEELKKYE